MTTYIDSSTLVPVYVAERVLIEELRRFARGEAYDEQPMPRLGSEAVARASLGGVCDKLCLRGTLDQL
ncbi:MAG: hypothetical protein GEU90_22565 [Gemmatimonas sp.]|nr:hypothetical protein [Gemmatimonas sp.]